jgi:hypothetical protein
MRAQRFGELASGLSATGPLWDAIVSSVAKVNGCRLLVLTTSGDPVHWSYRVLQHTNASNAWRVSETPGPVPWVSPAALEEQRGLLTDSQYARLHLNKWSASEDRLVDTEKLAAAVTLDGPQDPRPGVIYRVGVDIGLRHDRTAIAVCHSEVLPGESRRTPGRARPDGASSVRANARSSSATSKPRSSRSTSASAVRRCASTRGRGSAPRRDSGRGGCASRNGRSPPSGTPKARKRCSPCCATGSSLSTTTPNSSTSWRTHKCELNLDGTDDSGHEVAPIAGSGACENEDQRVVLCIPEPALWDTRAPFASYALAIG